MNNIKDTLIQQIDAGPIDIIGDIHGEYDSLINLINKLGYKLNRTHKDNRKIVFVGDFCDRGPKSVETIYLIKNLIESNKAYAILGNHEINLLNNDPKDGSGWYFESRHESDSKFYAPFTSANEEQKIEIKKFLATLPIAVYRDDIRIVHATWDNESIKKIENIKNSDLINFLKTSKFKSVEIAKESDLWNIYQNDLIKWRTNLEDPNNPPPFLDSIADFDALERIYNPIKVLTSGMEEKTSKAFYSGNKWRFSDRTPWWNKYQDETPVVIGHYWRLFNPQEHSFTSRYSKLFADIPSNAWHGALKNVFCVDYSVGATWRNRSPNNGFKLAALQWPERKLVFSSGEIVNTI